MEHGLNSTNILSFEKWSIITHCNEFWFKNSISMKNYITKWLVIHLLDMYEQNSLHDKQA